MSEVKGNREPRDAIGREPLVREPDVRAKAQTAALELPMELFHRARDESVRRMERKVAEAQRKKLLVGAAMPALHE
jgi:hypothetical protein